MTSRQREIYEFIKAFINDNGYPPTIREISDHFEFSSPSGALAHIEALQKKGFIERDHASRGIRIVTQNPFDVNFAEVIGEFYDDGKIIAISKTYNIPVPVNDNSIFAVRSLICLKIFSILKYDYIIFGNGKIGEGLVLFDRNGELFVGSFENGKLKDLRGEKVDTFDLHGVYRGILRVPEMEGLK